MFLIKRIITVALSVIVSLASIILLAIINSLAHTGLTGGQVVLYGLLTGIVLGVFTGYFVTYLLVRKARKFIYTRLGNVLGRLSFLRRV